MDMSQAEKLAPPVVSTLRKGRGIERGHPERTNTMDIREEREDLREAAEQSLNIILDLSLDGTIRWVSPSWRDVIGTEVDAVIKKPIADLLLSNQDSFDNTIESMKTDDSKSRIIRFKVELGPLSVLRKKKVKSEDVSVADKTNNEDDNEGQELNLEGQGIMVYDRSSGGESHTMWMLRPSNPPREITIDLPELLVDSLGLGAEILAHYLTGLAESGANDPANHPPPLPVLCRICERQITPWWFEKHSQGCTQEYRAEEAVNLAQESLVTHRPAIAKVLDALDPEVRRSRSLCGESQDSSVATPEYKGMFIGPLQPSPGTDSGSESPRNTSRSRESSVSGSGHTRGKSFTVRRPLYRVAELIMDLCDTAIEINTPAIKGLKEQRDSLAEIRTQSPHSENLISQILNWTSPSNTLDQEPGLATLATDTENLARAKIEAVFRHREIIEYSERIRVEFNLLVMDCIDAAVEKAKKIKEGQLSDSSSEEENEEEAQTPAASEARFPMSVYDGPSSMATALRSASPLLMSQTSQPDRRQSSASASSRSSSPMECPTPRSHTTSASLLGRSDSVNKRSSLYMESDAGDSDTSIPMSHSQATGGRRTHSPNMADLSLSRSASLGEKKRRSLKLPNMPSSHRQTSPARMPPPSSPLKMPKSRMSMNLDSLPSLPSPVASPPLSNTEMSSPITISQRHRRQSSAASSTADANKPPSSPRVAALSQPPARAVSTSIKDFEIIKPISKGAFGSVYLSKKKATGEYFAIKVLRKADMVAKNQVTNVKAERAIMMWQGESDFVAKLYWTFSSKDYLFLVMEYLNGGDCAALVKVLGGLSEEWAKKYIAEVVLGVEHLHSRSIVHRDLKPDNLLIDQKGHLKLTDFGLSRMGLIGRQKRALKSPQQSTPDLFKFGPFARASSIGSSRSTSFDMQGNHSPQSTPVMTPDLAGSIGQPSYFSLSRESVLGREHSRRKSGYRSDSGNSDTFNSMFRNFSLNDDAPGSQRDSRIEEETHSEGDGSPDPYALRPTTSNPGNLAGTPPHPNMLPPPMALFDPEDQNRRFVGTPDYLAPETINGLGQDEMSDWWSLGCITFELLYGYPPFHGDTPEEVFENILARNIDWPEDSDAMVSAEAKDFMNSLMAIEPKARLGSNTAEKHSNGGEEIRRHPWFEGLKWDTLLEDEAEFVPAPQDPEDTEYFDARGATLQAFTEEMEDQGSSVAVTPGAELSDRPHDALNRARNQVNSLKRGLMPLHIPAHVRDNRSRRLSEPVVNDDFGNFSYKNLPVLEKANQDVLQKLIADSTQKPTKLPNQSPAPGSGAPSLESSPLLPMPLKRAKSTNKAPRPASPSNLGPSSASPNKISQPTSPMLVSFSTGQHHERRKTSSNSSSLSHPPSASLQLGQGFDPPRLPRGPSTASGVSATSSPIKSNRNSMALPVTSPERVSGVSRPTSMYASTSRTRSQTVGSQEGDVSPAKPFHYKRQSQVFDISPSSSDTEDTRTKALRRVQQRRQSSRRMSQLLSLDGPQFRPLDVLICEDHPVSKIVLERLLERLKCRTITVSSGPEAARYAMSEVQFDIIMIEYKLPQINGADVARMIRDTKSANSNTPIICVTGYLKELPQTHHFDSLIEKQPTIEKLTEAFEKLCAWKPPPPNYEADKNPKEVQKLIPSGLRQESRHNGDSPSSMSSGPFTHVAGSHRRSSREHSIGSSVFGDTDSTNTEDVPVIVGRQSDDWASNGGLGISEADFSPPSSDFTHPGLPHLIHQNSAPPSTTPRAPRKKASVDAVRAKRENLEKKRHECAESGDDEDEELGDLSIPPKARSPQGKLKGSKLGTEMMRTNSRGSVTSTIEEPVGKSSTSANSDVPPPEMLQTKEPKIIEPPELFPKTAAGDAVEVIDMDATPRPPKTVVNAAIGQADLPDASSSF